MKSDWYEPYKYWDPFVEWKTEKESDKRKEVKEN